MERMILRYSYWLGVACAVIAVLWRIANFFNLWVSTYVPGFTIAYMTFMKGAVLFFLLSIATAQFMAHGSTKS